MFYNDLVSANNAFFYMKKKQESKVRAFLLDDQDQGL